jgi:hypothetical protein
MSDGRDEAANDADARLVAGLGQALGPSTSPPGLVERANGLLAFASLDRELAQLLETSPGELVGTRGTAEPSTVLRFEVADGSVAVEVSLAPGRLVGQVIAGPIAEVVLERLSGPSTTATVDDLGRFEFERPGTRPARLALRGARPEPVATDWFLP